MYDCIQQKHFLCWTYPNWESTFQISSLDDVVGSRLNSILIDTNTVFRFIAEIWMKRSTRSNLTSVS